jgi:hypothetical protein
VTFPEFFATLFVSSCLLIYLLIDLLIVNTVGLVIRLKVPEGIASGYN